MAKMTRRRLLKVAGGAVLGLGATGLGYTLTNNAYRQNRRLIDEINLGSGAAIAAEPGQVLMEADTIYGLVSMALMQTVAWAEGTYIPGLEGYNPYRVLVGSSPSVPRLATSWDDHPRSSFVAPRWRSDAAGAYQFLSSTWDSVQAKYKSIWHSDLPAFAPQNQDRAFLALAGERGGLQRLLDGIVVLNQRISVDAEAVRQAMYAFSREWASIPGYNIGEATGQSTKTEQAILSNFFWFLRERQPRFLHNPPAFPVGGDYSFTNTRISDTYKARSATRWHWGIDLAIPTGTPLIAVEDGVISVAGWDQGGGGNIVRLEDSTWAGDSYLYMHLDQFEPGIQPGAAVRKGDVIGWSGNTGRSTGPHLHFEWVAGGQGGAGYKVDPYRLLGASYWYGSAGG